MDHLNTPIRVHALDADADGTASQLPEWLSLAGAGVFIARFAGFDEAEHFLVTTVNGEPARPAASTVALGEHDVGVAVVVALEGGDARHPIILGRLQERGKTSPPSVPLVRVDGDRLLLQAEREIELRCGEASLVLTRAGKVLIRGTYVLSRSRGANRIKGAYVDIN